MLASVSAAALPVVAPLLAILAVAAAVVVHLHSLDRQLPVFDIGALTVLAAALYSAIPLIGFWLAGLQWTPFSYLPLWVHQPSPAEVGGFAWRHVLYLYSFAGTYLLFRGRAIVRCGPIRQLRPSAVTGIVIVLCALLGYFQALELLFGVSYDPSYSDLTITGAADALPLVIRQLSHNLFAIIVLLKVALLAWAMQRWADWRWRYGVLLWLIAEGVMTATRMGGRTWYATLLMAAVLLYHRLVRPLPAARAFALVLLLLGGILVYGLARDIGGGLRTVAEADHSPWVTMNEFQALYGIAYDLQMRKEAGTVGPIPWQIHVGDVVRLVPSQFLPFEKADPCLGYAQIDGIGLGCVLGVISHAIVGLDWIELLLRGIGLGLLFAMFHRWYARHQSGYWATMLYLYLCLWSYYTFRGSAFYFAYYVVYRFLPMLVMVRLAQVVVRNGHRIMMRVGV